MSGLFNFSKSDMILTIIKQLTLFIILVILLLTSTYSGTYDSSIFEKVLSSNSPISTPNPNISSSTVANMPKTNTKNTPKTNTKNIPKTNTPNAPIINTKITPSAPIINTKNTPKDTPPVVHKSSSVSSTSETPQNK